MLSIVIPSKKDPHLYKTVEDILQKARGDIEIIVVLDGDVQDIPQDDRVRTIRLYKSRGMRNAINKAVALARGEYLMKCDAHCMFAEGFDITVLETIQDDWVVIPRMYKLDVDTWAVMDDRPIDYSKIVYLESHDKLHGQECPGRAKTNADKMVDSTMIFQGSCWIMSRKWWDNTIRNLDEQNYGTFAQEPLEIAMLTYKAGGRCMVNKNTWYAHKHRKFNRTHKLRNSDVEKGNKYALDTWREYIETELIPNFI